MTYNIFRKSFVIGIILLFIGASVLPSITGEIQKIYNVEIVNDVLSKPLPRWREGGTPYNPEQSLHPYAIKLRDSPTSGLIESPPEYDPTRGVLFCYMSGSWNEVVVDLVVALTQDDDFDEIAYVLVTSESQMNTATNQFTSNGANMDKVEFIIKPANAIWMRDYGPHFIWQNGALGIVDSHYYPTRPLDNFIPTLIGDDYFIMPTYDIGLYYSGGNFQPGPNGTAFMSALINTDNPSYQGFSEEFIAELFQTYQGIDELHILPQLPGSVDGTGHIDMWMYIIDEDTVIISQFLPGSNPTAIEITENAVPYMEDLGFTVYRTPAWNANHPDNGYSTHWTYTNSFRVNDRIFIPTYGSTYPAYEDEDAQALAAFEAAAPDVEIVEINCFPIIWAAGAIHCIVMQVPRHTDSEPSVHVIWPDGGEFLASGTTQTIEWVATDTDNAEISQIDLYYSIDGGNDYDFIDSTNDTGFYDWIVPYVETDEALIKVVAKSADSDQGVGTSSDVFNISSSNQSVYDFVTGASENKFCYGHQTTSWSLIDGERKPVTTEISSSNYPKLAYSDATGNDNDPNRYISPTPSGGYESTHIFEFEIEEEYDNIYDIEIFWEGYSDDCSQIELYVWDYIEEQWGDGDGLFNQNRYMDNWAGNRDGYLKKQIRSDFNRYISTSGQMTLLLYTERPSDRSFHDYISVTVSRINDPPDAPTIDGPTSGDPQVEYDFTFVTSDPEEDDIWYKIDWGDGNVTDWIGPYENEQEITRSHSWSENGIYQIKAKANDSWTESPWSNPYPIKIGNYAPDAPTIDGPTSGDPQVEYDFTFVTSDPEEDDIWYKIDWGDGNVTDWIGPYENEQEITRSHSWSENGIYQIKAKAKDSQTESPWSNPYPIKIGNYAPDAPTIDGPPSGKPGKEYEFTLNSTDPDEDDVKYFIDWGDNNTYETDFYASGTDAKVKHTWSDKGDYTIKAKAIDVYDAESELSTFEINIPKNKAFNFYHNMLSWLFERFPNIFTILRHILGILN